MKKCEQQTWVRFQEGQTMSASLKNSPGVNQDDQLKLLRQLDLQWEEINASIHTKQRQVTVLQERLAALLRLFSAQEAGSVGPSGRLKQWMNELAQKQQVIEQLLEQERHRQRLLEQEFDIVRLKPEHMRQQALGPLNQRRTYRQRIEAALPQVISHLRQFGLFLLQGAPVVESSRQFTRQGGLYLL
jgi:hypothetical protein